MTETPAEYYVSRAPKSVRGLDTLRERIQNWFKVLTVESRCYAIGLALLVIAAVLAMIRIPHVGMLGQVGALVFALGLLPLIERLYEWAWKKLVGKLLIAGLIALATNMAYGFGRQMVAGLVGTSPEPFGATVNVATILISPVLFFMVLAFGGILIFGFVLCGGMFAVMNLLPPTPISARKKACLWLCRCAALSIAIFGSWYLVNLSNSYAGWVERRTAGYLYNFDMYHDAQYAPGQDEKVALLSDARILLASPKQGEGYEFTIRRPADDNEEQR